MRQRIGAALVAGLLSAGSGVLVAQPNRPDALLRAAIETETVRGDLKGAIEQYSLIAQTADRAIAAKALLRMAECYEKLNDPISRSFFERLIREFPDRTLEVEAARAHLDRRAFAAPSKGDRVIWSGPRVDPMGRASADGRVISFVDWNDGRLMLHDVASNTDRALTQAVPNYAEQAEWSVVSRDGRQVVFDWLAGGREEFRIARIPASGFIEPRKLNDGYFTSMDWSPDGTSIAAVKWLPDRTGQIGVISVADGSFRGLKWIPGNALARAATLTTLAFSPDGRHIAFDLPAEGQQQRDVFILAVDGSREIPAVIHGANDAVVGWSPDGSRLLFSSDRTGTTGLWAQPFVSGQPSGAPELLKADIGAGFALGLLDRGALYFHKIVSTRDVAIAAFDVKTGRLLAAPTGFSQGFVAGAINPVWSPDGKSLAYPVTCSDGCTAIRTIATGQVRRVGAGLTAARVPQWSPDGQRLVVSGKDARGRDGIFAIDANSGQVTPVVLSPELSAMAQWSPDGQKVYFSRNGVFIERDLHSESERVVNAETGERYGVLSPNGNALALAHQDPSTGVSQLTLVPVTEGTSRTVLSLPASEGMFRPGTGSWLPDSSALIVQKYTGVRWELWLIPVTGEQPRRLEIDPEIWRDGSGSSPRAGVMQGDVGFSISPDGRQLALMRGRTAAEVWVLENFLTNATGGR